VSDLYINIPLAKGCILRLSYAEYRRALARGKAWRRHEQFVQRTEAARQEAREAGGERKR
jgi:hypothetical protein